MKYYECSGHDAKREASVLRASRQRTGAVSVATVLVACCAIACSEADVSGTTSTNAKSDPAEKTSSSEGALASAFGYKADGSDSDGRWTIPWASPGVVNLCFVGPNNGGTDTDAPDTARVATVMTTLRNSWESATGLTFVNKGRCPSSIPNAWISVYVDEKGSNGASWGGIGSRMTPEANWQNRSDIQTYFGDRPGAYGLQVAHEFGHALGFYHEMERNDKTDACGGGGNDRGFFTSYDRDSIMIWSYCTSVRTEDQLLSSMDRLGAEMMYPKQTSGHKLACADGCIESADGAIVRTDGAVTIDWLRRGANLAVINPTWHIGSSTVRYADGRLKASSLTASSTAVTMDFPDGFNTLNIPAAEQHARMTGGGTIVKSNEAHTAVLQAAASASTI